MFGISAYFKDLDLDYVSEAASLGAKFVFTSLHIPEDDNDQIEKMLPVLSQKCKDLGLLLICDVSPRTFQKLGLENEDFESLKKFGFEALRLDFGFDDPKSLVDLQKDFIIMLNASIIDKDYLQECKNIGLNMSEIIMTHNFYPHQDTGLEVEYFSRLNKDFIELDLRVQAFVSGDSLKRYPFYEGLPTLEDHRGLNSYVAAVDLIKTHNLTEVIVGDSKAKIDSLKYIHDFMEHKILTINANLEDDYKHLYDQVLSIRKDSGKVVRVVSTRTEDIPIYHTVERTRGSITIDNSLYGRYSGEISIIKKSVSSNPKVNVIGYVHPEYIKLIDYIDSDVRIRFIK